MTAPELAVPLTLSFDAAPLGATPYSASAQHLTIEHAIAHPGAHNLNEPPTMALALIGVATVAVFRGLHKRLAARPAPAKIAKPAVRKNHSAGKSQPGRKKQQGRKPIKPRRRAA